MAIWGLSVGLEGRRIDQPVFAGGVIFDCWAASYWDFDSGLRAAAGPVHPDTGFKGVASDAKRQAQLIHHQAKDNVLPRIPREQTIDNSAAGPDDLCRHVDQCLAERGRVHPQQAGHSPRGASLPNVPAPAAVTRPRLLISMPFLHWPVVSTIVPSASRMASFST